MAQYVPNQGSLTVTTLPNQVGVNYHVGMSDGTRFFGYLYQNQGKDTQGIKESTNITDKQALVQYSSPNLIDRDLAYFPRVTQGDWSGGALQTAFINANQFFDSDLDTSVPGYLRLRPLQQQVSMALGVNTRLISQVISVGSGIVVVTFAETNGNIYASNLELSSSLGTLPTFTTYTPTASATIALCTDGNEIFAGQAGSVYATGILSSSFTAVATALNVTATNWWAIQDATNGQFLYYTNYTNSSSAGSSLYKIDIGASRPVVAASQPQVPTGSNRFRIIDLCPSGTGIAILTIQNWTLGGNVDSFDVWQHDGTNMTRIVHVDGYGATGICNCLGNLYVSAMDEQINNSPVLIKIESGTFTIVARPGLPGQFGTFGQNSLQPIADGEMVYWPVQLESTALGLPINAQSQRVLAYDTITGSAAYMAQIPNGSDFGGAYNTNASSLSTRYMTQVGSSLVYAYRDRTLNNGVVQFGDPPGQGGNSLWQSAGQLLSSNLDFGTPGIAKRFRTIEAHHAALKAGQSITVAGYVDADPTAFGAANTYPTPTATVTNSTVGATVTLLTFGASVVGRTLFYRLQLGAGTGNNTTPVVQYVAVEVGGTWTWDIFLDCTTARRTLMQQPDDQGVTGKDLYFMLRNSYENGNTLTLYLANGLSYTVTVESMDANAPGYVAHTTSAVQADEDWLVHVVLRQSA